MTNVTERLARLQESGTFPAPPPPDVGPSSLRVSGSDIFASLARQQQQEQQQRRQLEEPRQKEHEKEIRRLKSELADEKMKNARSEEQMRYLREQLALKEDALVKLAERAREDRELAEAPLKRSRGGIESLL